MTKFRKNIIIFLIFGFIYFSLEIIYRGYSFVSMFILGGACGLLVGLLDENFPKLGIFYQMLIGSLIITLLEFITGYILNIKLGLHIWDYSNCPLNFKGQISFISSFVWFLLSYFAIKLDDYLRYKVLK